MIPKKFLRLLPSTPVLGQTSGNVTINFDRDSIYKQFPLTGDLFINIASSNNNDGIENIFDVIGDGVHSVYINNSSNLTSLIFQKTKRNIISLKYINGSVVYQIFNPITTGLQDINLVIVGNSISTEGYGTWHTNLVSKLQLSLASFGFTLNITPVNGYTFVGQSISSMVYDIPHVQTYFDSSKTNVLLAVGEPLHTFIDTNPPGTAQQGADDINNYCNLIKQGHPEWKVILVVGFGDVSTAAFVPANYNALMAQAISILQGQIAGGTNKFDSLAIVDNIYNDNISLFTFEGLHPTGLGYINGNIIKRSVDGILQALLGNSQPADIYLNTVNYQPQTLPITFSGLTDNSGRILAGGTVGVFGNLGLSDKCLATGQNGRITFKVESVSSVIMGLGTKYATLPTGYANMQIGLGVATGGGIARTDNGVFSQANSASTGDFLSINRVGSTITAEKLNLITGNWDIIYTYGFTSSSTLFIFCDLEGTKYLLYPSGINTSNIVPFFSDTFNRANNASSPGNLEVPSTQVWTTISGTWTTLANHLACSTAQGILVTDIGRTYYVIKATLRSFSGGGSSRVGIVFYYTDLNHYFVAEIINNAGVRQLNIYAIVNGTIPLANVNLTGNAEITTLKLYCTGGDVRVYENDVQVFYGGGYSPSGSSVGFIQNAGTNGEYFDDFSLI